MKCFCLVLLVAAPALASAQTETPAADPATSVTERAAAAGFAFGSYGRVLLGSDFEGGTPDAVNVVAHGARIVEPTYVELDMYYRMRAENGVLLSTVTTLAFGDQLFHQTGEFDARLALRNLYLLAEKGPVSVWAGSRMYRGDTIYLLDYWPLDDVNTLGGGVGYNRDRLGLAAHVGINRLLDPFQFQEREVLSPGFGSEEIPQLDRLRYIATTHGSYEFLRTQNLKLRAKLYGEMQALPAGERRRDDATFEKLPGDFGFAAGGQLTAWDFAERGSHGNLFIRYSRGLSAFDELSVPMGLSPQRKVFPQAAEWVFGLSGSYEIDRFGTLVGAYARRFEDADTAERDRDDGWEYIGNVRPRVDIWGGIQGAVDLSFQARFPRGVSPNTLTAMDPAVFQVAPMIVYSPFGEGSLARPQFRLVYRAAHLNAGARDLYPMEDPRQNLPWVHYLGIQAEWWFNSTQTQGVAQ